MAQSHSLLDKNPKHAAAKRYTTHNHAYPYIQPKPTANQPAPANHSKQHPHPHTLFNNQHNHANQQPITADQHTKPHTNTYSTPTTNPHQPPPHQPTQPPSLLHTNPHPKAPHKISTTPGGSTPYGVVAIFFCCCRKVYAAQLTNLGLLPNALGACIFPVLCIQIPTAAVDLGGSVCWGSRVMAEQKSSSRAQSGRKRAATGGRGAASKPPSAGQTLRVELEHEGDPMTLKLLIRQAARVADRLETIDSLISGRAEVWASLSLPKPAGRGRVVVEVRIDKVLVEERNQSTLYRHLIGEIHRLRAGLPPGEEGDNDDDLVE